MTAKKPPLPRRLPKACVLTVAYFAIVYVRSWDSLLVLSMARPPSSSTRIALVEVRFQKYWNILDSAVIIRREQIEAFEAKAERDFLLESIADWFAIYEHVQGEPPEMSFDDAWDVGEYVLEKLEGVAWNPHSDCAYEVQHLVLNAWERGVPEEVVEQELDFFADAMPAEEAALELLSWGLEASVPPDAEGARG
jgi:hypothetical protein